MSYRALGPLDPIFDVEKSTGAIQVGNTSPSEPPPPTPTVPTGLVIRGSVSDATLNNAGSVKVLPGGYVVVASANDNAVTTVDVSVPTAPTIADSVTASALNGALDVAVQGNYAYVAAQLAGRMTVVDVSDPTNISIVGSLSHADFGFANGVAVQGDYAYLVAGSTDKLHVINVSNPASPTLAGQTAADATNLSGVFSVCVDGDYAYVGAVNNSRVTVVDVSNPAAPVVVGSVQDVTFIGSVRRLTKYEDHLFVTTQNGGVTTINVTTPTAPAIVDTLSLGVTEDAAMWGEYLVVADSSNDGVVLIDPRVPTALVVIDDAFDVSVMDGTRGVAADPDAQYVYATGRVSDSLVVLEIV